MAVADKGMWVGLPLAAAIVSGCASDAPPQSVTTPAETVCPADGAEGTGPGDILVDVEIKQCDGSKAMLRSLVCGHSLTLIDVGAAAFAMCVEATDDYATGAEFDALQAEGLQIVQVFVGDEQLMLPTTKFCSEYSTAHQVDFDFLIDPVSNTDTYSTTHPFNLVVDAEGRIVHKWEGELPTDRVDVLQTLLNDAN